jgi:hypothetical protein
MINNGMNEATKEISIEPTMRKAVLDEVAEHGQERRDQKKITFHIGHREIVLHDLVARAARLVQWGKSLVDQAVKPSAEASLIWAGVCLVLPLLTEPTLAEKANEDGFAYVTSRMDYYVELEPLLCHLPIDIVSEGLKKVVEEKIVKLYQQILDFQIRSILRFYRGWRKNVARALVQDYDWKAMYSNIQAVEKALKDDFEQINDAVLVHRLDNLDKDTKESVDIMRRLLSAASKLLQAQLQQHMLTKYVALSHSHLFRLTPQ